MNVVTIAEAKLSYWECITVAALKNQYKRLLANSTTTAIRSEYYPVGLCEIVL